MALFVQTSHTAGQTTLPESFCYILSLHIGASLVAQLVKNPPAMWETWVPSLGWEDPLKEVDRASQLSLFTCSESQAMLTNPLR